MGKKSFAYQFRKQDASLVKDFSVFERELWIYLQYPDVVSGGFFVITGNIME